VFVFADVSELKVENLAYFAKYGMCENCSNVDYVFVVNGKTNFVFPTFKNVKVYENDQGCGDFGAWNFLFEHHIDYKKYKRLMFINDTVRGPFVDPHYRFMLGEDFHFTDIFASYLTNDTKLVGSYINCGTVSGNRGAGFSHVQSMVWMTDDVGMEIVRPLIKCYPDKYATVALGEIGLSRTMIENGYNIASLFYAYRGVDFRTDEDHRTNCNNQEDATYPGRYFGDTVSPTEVIFYKNSRQTTVVAPHIANYPKWLGPAQLPLTRERV